jgi:hypothetical protein
MRHFSAPYRNRINSGCNFSIGGQENRILHRKRVEGAWILDKISSEKGFRKVNLWKLFLDILESMFMRV